MVTAGLEAMMNRQYNNQGEKWTALYVRLSRDDENEGDSNSIQHQEKALGRLGGGFPAVGKEMVRRITDRVEHDAAPRLNGPIQREAMDLRRRVNIQTSGNAQDWLF